MVSTGLRNCDTELNYAFALLDCYLHTEPRKGVMRNPREGILFDGRSD